MYKTIPGRNIFYLHGQHHCIWEPWAMNFYGWKQLQTFQWPEAFYRQTSEQLETFHVGTINFLDKVTIKAISGDEITTARHVADFLWTWHWRGDSMSSMYNELVWLLSGNLKSRDEGDEMIAAWLHAMYLGCTCHRSFFKRFWWLHNDSLSTNAQLWDYVIHFRWQIAKGGKGALFYSQIVVNDGKGQRVQ